MSVITPHSLQDCRVGVHLNYYIITPHSLQDCRVGVHLNYYNTCLQLSGTEQMIGAFLYFRESYSTVLLHCTQKASLQIISSWLG